MAAPYQGDSYQGIIDAFNTLRAAQGEKKYSYDPNYRGIIEAILDLKKWGQAGDGDNPPGWVPEYDEDGNVIGGDWNPSPDNGTLWFDERQGRLFIWVDDGFYQTNGGDGLPHVGENPPASEIPGSLWFNTSTQVLYLYDGQTWTIVSSAGAGATTATLMLSDPTTSQFKATRPYLPDTSGLGTQQDFNKWIYQALEGLEDEIEANAGEFQVYMSDTPPADVTEGDLWYNTNKLQMLIRYDGAWVASAIPLVLDDSFVALSNTVEANRELAAQAVNNAIALIEQIGARPERRFGLSYDLNENGIQLTDSKGDSHIVKFAGADGININVTNSGIQIDASALSNEIHALEQIVASDANVSAIAERLSIAEGNLSTLLNTAVVSPIAFSNLSQVVAELPTASDVSGRLSLLGGTMEGSLTMGNHRIQQVGIPVNNNDAARKLDVDNVKDYADSTFINKNAGVISGFSIQKSDVLAPVFDFTGNPSTGMNAFKLRTYGGSNNFTSFGTTENKWEYAWNFGSEEDFCWVHGTTGKQVSINKDGLTAKKLVLGNFLPNNDNGTVVMNKIDVGETLQAIKSALQASSSFEEFKAQVLASI